MEVVGKFIKKPVHIEAVQFTGNVKQLPYEFAVAVTQDEPGNSCFVKTYEGSMECKPGNWLLKGIKGEIYPCDNEIFAKTYRAATKYDHFVGEFAVAMTRKLVDNDHKTGWKNLELEWLLKRVSEEVEELVQAVAYDVGENFVLDEAADVANMVAMVADAYKNKRKKA